MSNSKAGIVFGIVIGIIIIWLLNENEKKDKQIKSLQKEIDENENLTNSIKNQLRALINNNKEVAPKIANELSQIAALLEIKQDTTAILKMSKIIESLLKEYYKDSVALKEIVFKNNRKKPALSDYLEMAKEDKIISAEDYHLLLVMKIIRNEEAHEVNINKEKSRMVAAFISGIGIILVLCKILKKKTIVSVSSVT